MLIYTHALAVIEETVSVLARVLVYAFLISIVWHAMHNGSDMEGYALGRLAGHFVAGFHETSR